MPYIDPKNQSDMRRYIPFLFTLFSLTDITAQVRPSGIFGDHMVLQRNKPIRVWGTASPGEKVTVQFNSKALKVKASSSGDWQVTLPAMTHGGPYTMTITGKDTVKFSDILVGEVWICSGQSNMEWNVNSSDSAKKEIANAKYPQIRQVKISKDASVLPRKDISKPAPWVICSPETVANFTAAGYFFARELQEKLGVPVGLINSSWGGTHVETWTSGDALFAHPDFAGLKQKYPTVDTVIKAPNAYGSLLYNAMINPIVGYGVGGAIWYQGESNASRADQYNISFPMMIKDWRSRWNDEFPFYFVQLANFQAAFGNSQNGGSQWAELREAQTNTLSLPNTGMAVIIDIGNSKDIHPRNKQDVGKRLALLALGKTYKLDIPHESPMFESMTTDRNTVTIRFKNTYGGLTVRNKYGYVNGFEVAGTDQKFHYAQARLQDGQVIVTCDKVTSPVAVRYGWADDPNDLNLYNSASLPAAPFRTDNWDKKTKGVRFGY